MELDVEQEVQNVAVFHHVFLAFCTHLAGILGALLALVGNEIIKRYGLRANEAALEVAVDHASSLWGGVSNVDGPGAHFLHAGVIHGDFERGFIRAQTIAFDDFIAYKGEQGAKDAGKMRAEGKEYVVKAGDVLNFLFNV